MLYCIKQSKRIHRSNYTSSQLYFCIITAISAFLSPITTVRRSDTLSITAQECSTLTGSCRNTMVTLCKSKLWILIHSNKCTKSSQCRKVKGYFVSAQVECTVCQLTASSLITAITTSIITYSIAPEGGGNTLTTVTAKLARSTLNCMGSHITHWPLSQRNWPEVHWTAWVIILDS